MGINDWDWAVGIKDYNYALHELKLVDKKFEESRILLVPYSELHCREEISGENALTPSIKDINAQVKSGNQADQSDSVVSIQDLKKPGGEGMRRYEPLFGPKWSNVPIEDFKLENRVFYILPGHGGPDPGAVCTDCSPVLCEDEYAYDVSLRLARNLMQHGAIVHVIVQDPNDGIRDDRYLPCDTDEKTINGAIIPRNHRQRLRQRTNDINQLYNQYSKKKNIKSQTMIEIHIDSRHSDKRIDVFFSYPKGSDTAKKLANNMKNTFERKYSKHQANRGYKGFASQQNFFVINNVRPAAVLVELGNIKNQQDHQRILNPANRQAVANWMFHAIMETYN
jgi:N-acetylmuramoyl-L-alanine amidase